MTKSNIPGLGHALSVKPPLPPNVQVSDFVQQTLALLLGFTYGETVALRSSPGGVLYTASPRLNDVEHWTATGANWTHQGNNVQCTEILCMGHHDNTGLVWVRTRAVATANNAFPLAKGDVMGFSVENLDELQALIVVNGEKLIVGYSL
jgi:hypothetical protein